MACEVAVHADRSRPDDLLTGKDLGLHFHRLFDISASRRERLINGEQKENKQKKKKHYRTKDKSKVKGDKSPELDERQQPSIDLLGNPSPYAVYASVRQSVLENQIRLAAQVYNQLVQTKSPGSDSDEDEEEKGKEKEVTVPKIVGLGLCGVFELIRETHSSHPALCVKALRALLDMLQGQQPEQLRREPQQVLDALYQLLMEISVVSGVETAGRQAGDSLPSLACSCLLSLVIARGDTGKLLRAVSSSLMGPAVLSRQVVKVPGILTELQRSVQSVLLGRAQHPDWLGQGIRKGSLLMSVKLDIATSSQGSIASDGQYLYISNSQGLHKVGTGYGGTIKGFLYMTKPDFHPKENVWLAFAQKQLFSRSLDDPRATIKSVNRETLVEEHPYLLKGDDNQPSVMFSDGEHICHLTTVKDDSFSVRTYNPSTSPMPVVSELQLKLARKCLSVFGVATFDTEAEMHTINAGVDEELVHMVSGKEFGLVRTASGKILYTGKGQCLGIKQGNAGSSKFSELPITKSPKVTQCSVGHEGQHSLLLAEDGSVFFVGTARRGEDGDSGVSKGRRQMKAVKPKKMIKLESKTVIHTACNSGTSALVTKDGEVYMFGKDTAHCDHATGLVTDLKEVKITSIALGKAHAVALTSKGHVYSFGINNKGQCGRDYVAGAFREVSTAVTMADEEETDEADPPFCQAGKHRWKREECMLCTQCNECTGYGSGCVNSDQPNRNPGSFCGCGRGDSGCSVCGVCKVCAGETVTVEPEDDDSAPISHPLDLLGQMLAGDREGGAFIGNHVDKMDGEAPVQEKPPRPNRGRGAGGQRAKSNRSRAKGNLDGLSSDAELEQQAKLVSLPPERVDISRNRVPAVQVACGLQHAVVLLENGDVYTFGGNHYGQLGHGDTSVRGVPTKVPLKDMVTQVTAGSYHTVLLTSSGQVYTFGNYKKGQLGRLEPEENQAWDKVGLWHGVPGPVPKIGAKHGRRATWIGASGDQTYIRVDESLINAHTLAASCVFANQTCIGLVPHEKEQVAPLKCLMINRRDGNCRSFSEVDQVSLANSAVCLDPLFDVLWGYSPATRELNCYHVLKSEVKDIQSGQSGVGDILGAELAVPVKFGALASRSHAALHMLGCLDTLTAADEMHLIIHEEEMDKQVTNKVYSKEDFSAVNRFESHGGGWGYSGHSVEAIRFMADTDILLGGLGLFGGRGEYFGKIKIFELGPEGGENETDGDLLIESEEMPFECGAREKYAMLLEEPMLCQANHWYVAWARVSGPSSDCGSNGQGNVTTEDQVVFKFKSSKKSNNGTDVNAGQIPQLLYRLPVHESGNSVRNQDQVEPAHILSQEFSCTVSPDCFEALLGLLHWGWNTFNSAVEDAQSLKGPSLAAAVLDLERLAYICCACLRLLRTYICEMYPPQGPSRSTPSENQALSCSVGDTRALLRKILIRSRRQTLAHQPLVRREDRACLLTLYDLILNQCLVTFTACFHAFYPTGPLKWTCLCDLLDVTQPGSTNVEGYSRLLAAVLKALCQPTVRLTSMLPIMLERVVEHAPLDTSGVSDSNAATPTGDSHHYPVLVSSMLQRSEAEGMDLTHWSFREVLDKLLAIQILPVRQALNQEKSSFPPLLVSNSTALVAAIVSELAAAATGYEGDFQSHSRPLLTTPNRFTRTSQNPYWNPGNGMPDAVCFTVDKPGVVIAGVCLYGGGGAYEYEMELLDDQQSDGSGDHSQSGRWNSLEAVKGSYGQEDCVNDIAEIRFDKPVALKVGIKYALRLKNKGPKTLNGDGGMPKVKGPDGTTFTYSACSLSNNGTNHTRGQIPQILYYSSPQDGDAPVSNTRVLAECQSRRKVIQVASAIIHASSDLLRRAQCLAEEQLVETLGSSQIFSTLLPLVLAYLGPVASVDPRSAVQVLGLVQEILPPVSELISQTNPNSPASPGVTGGTSSGDDNGLPPDEMTTTQHYAVVESEHPYKPASVCNFRVSFPESVRWMTIEFDPRCGTAQSEDTLQLYVPSRAMCVSRDSKKEKEETSIEQDRWWPVLKKFSGTTNWPAMAIIMPGNELCFSLETASDYVKDEKASFYGFKCNVIGYEWATKVEEGLLQLEKEITYLGGMCAASLLRKDILLPPFSEDNDEDIESAEEGALQIYNSHSQLLNKGFALSNPPSISQALDGRIPFSWSSNERSFLKDFVACTSGTSGGRLAGWLQPESYVDPRLCDVIYNPEEIKCSWPTVITVVTKDQYAQIVHVPNLKVEAKAVPVVQDQHHLKRRSKYEESDLTYGGHPPPRLDVPYQVTMRDKKDAFHAISMMKAYENYSLEELRYASPPVPRPSENMLIRANNDGTYSANWTPGSAGRYNIHVTIDDYETGEIHSVDVHEPPQGVLPPGENASKKKTPQPAKTRKFVAKWSSGLRVRLNPSLQSEQIGIIKPSGVISYIDEIHNDDGVWLRLSPDSIKKWCHNGYTEGWALQYNQQLGKTLLVPVEEPKSLLDEIIKDTILRRLPELISEKTRERKGGPGVYHVVKCGTSGHNIRSRPTKKSRAVGMLVMGNKVMATAEVTNAEGTWLKLDQEHTEHFCHEDEGEAWSLAVGNDGITYLQHEADQGIQTDPVPNFGVNAAASGTEGSTKGFDFTSAARVPAFSGFGSAEQGVTKHTGGLLFGQPPEQQTTTGSLGREKDLIARKISELGADMSPHLSRRERSKSPRPPVGDHADHKDSFSREIPKELQGVSVKELIKALGIVRVEAELLRAFPKDAPPVMEEFTPDSKGVSVKGLIQLIGESRVNGNGATPPRSPPGTPKKSSRSSSPKPIPGSSKRSSIGGSPGSSLSPKQDGAKLMAAALGTGSPCNTPPRTPPATRRDSPATGFVTPPQTPPFGRRDMFPISPRSASPVSSTQRSQSASPQRSPQSTLSRQGSSSYTSPQSTLSRGSTSSSLSSPQSTMTRSPHQSPHGTLARTGSPHVSPHGTLARSGSPYVSPQNTLGRSGSPHQSPHGTLCRSASPHNTLGRGGSPQSTLSRRLSTGSTGTGSSQSKTDSAMKAQFSIGASTSKEDARLSPKAGRKERSRSLRSKKERTQSPSSTKERSRKKSGSRKNLIDPVKQAMAPSLAECIRAVFAAFLWHEGIVHDAMACASYLKFHPNLKKEIPKSFGIALADSAKAKAASSKQASQCSQNMNINEALREAERMPLKERCNSEGPGREEASKKQPIDTPKKVESDLPPTLQHIVCFWEELATVTLKVVNQNMILPSPAVRAKPKKVDKKEKEREKDKKSKKKKEPKQQVQQQAARGNLFGEAAAPVLVGPPGDKSTVCELCEGSFPHPITYHMRASHPGCGRHAGGQGYNSGGNYCGGWAGNCGDGGIGGSTWYLLCERCRERYLKEKRQFVKDKTKKVKKKGSSLKQVGPAQMLEAHLVMKNNALFLLDMASASGMHWPSQAPQPPKRSTHSMRLDSSLPSVSEDSLLEGCAFPAIPFTYLLQHGASDADSAFAEEVVLDDEERLLLGRGKSDWLSQSHQLSGFHQVRPKRSESVGSQQKPKTRTPGDGADDLEKETEEKPAAKSAGASPEVDAWSGRQVPYVRSISDISGVMVSQNQTDVMKRSTQEVPVARKRNNSGSMAEGGLSLLKRPSIAMSKLIQSLDESRPGVSVDLTLQRPVMAFVTQRHDLDSLQLAMKQALRKSSCRVHGLQALNWLIRSVTQQSCLHDLLWFFVGALTAPPPQSEPEDSGEEKDAAGRPKENTDLDAETTMCEHPLSDVAIAGDAVHPLPTAFHSFLQTISDVMMYLPPGSSLQQMAIRCWCLKFRTSDHMFLHKSHVFSNISKILSKIEEEPEDMAAPSGNNHVVSKVECLKDLTAQVDLKASSRQAMIASLTDNSTETFWESGDEDRNKTKSITITCRDNQQPRLVYIHIDNSRDLGSKVSSINFSAGNNSEELKKLKQCELEPRHTGWVGCLLPEGRQSLVKVELKGPDNTLRVRQVKVLGEIDGTSLEVNGKKSTTVMQHRNCEAETLKVFRLLTSQVFGKLLSEPMTDEDRDRQKGEGPEGKEARDVDLKEHMVGILFSRSKLSHLQKQVCSHIVQSIQKETLHVQEEWEASITNRNKSSEESNRSSDAYCFELLSMVLALSGSMVGRKYLAQQYSLLQDLLTLLHTASPRVQRQVTALLRRVLPEVPPNTLANLLSVPSLPAKDFSIAQASSQSQATETFDPERPGILDVFLACIAKALTVQMKVKGQGGGKGISSVHLHDCLPPSEKSVSRWWLRGHGTTQLAESIISLLKDMANGKLSESWAVITKGAVAENILALTKLNEALRVPTDCIKTPTLWLSLASLCVLDQDHVDRLSSGQWIRGGDDRSQPKPTCDNHDDGETGAMILCSECGNLCADCDRFLHLHRRTKSHQRQVFKEEEEAIKVDLHEGCGRIKLFWLMALADSKTHKAMVEFREGTKGKLSGAGVVGTCRFCGTSNNTGILAIGNVCSDPECQEHARNACTKNNPCGHMCGGIMGEEQCLPCLYGCRSENSSSLKQDADDMCMICFTEALSAAPAIQLSCSHVFHLNCCRRVLEKRWVGPRITFGFSLCPICKSPIDHPVLKSLLEPIRVLYEDVRRKALMRLEYEGLHKAEAITTVGARFHSDPAGFAMERYAYYVCFKCSKAYYGGEARCEEQAAMGDEYDPSELVCGACSDVSRAQMCPKHGTDFLEYKCRYCCSVAVFFCFGTTHFCNACHDDFQRVTNIPKSELPHCPAGPRATQMDCDECPLHVEHPPTGEEFALGCGVCRNAHTF